MSGGGKEGTVYSVHAGGNCEGVEIEERENLCLKSSEGKERRDILPFSKRKSSKGGKMIRYFQQKMKEKTNKTIQNENYMTGES